MISDILNNQGSLAGSFQTNTPTFSTPKPYAYATGSGHPVVPNANGGMSSLGGPGYMAYMKTPKLAGEEDTLGKEYNFQNGLGYSKSAALNYKPTQASALTGGASSSGAPSGWFDKMKDTFQDSRAQAGVGDNDFSKMGTEGQMGVVNAGMNMVGLLGNFFK